MKPRSAMPKDELERDEEDPTEVFRPEEPDAEECKVKCLRHFSHLIDDFDMGDRISDPSQKVRIAYIGQKAAAEAAITVMEEEADVRDGLEEEIRQLEARLEGKIKKENDALEEYRRATNEVMCLEMAEPSRWNATFLKLKWYVMKKDKLPPVPAACTTEDDRKLSIWVEEMKSLVYSKSERIVNYPHRIEALESIGIEWIESSEESWNKMYARLAAYKRKHKTVRLPPFMQCRRSKDKDLIALRQWVDSQEVDVKSGAIAKRRDRLKKLQDLGLPFELTWEQNWDHYTEELLRFRSKYGHLDLAWSANSDLEIFMDGLLKRLKRRTGEYKLTKEEMDDLCSKGLMNDLKKLTSRPVGRPSVAVNQSSHGMKLIPLERVKEVNVWVAMLDQLRAYQADHGTLKLPPPRRLGGRGTGEYDRLHDWVEAQRRSYKAKTLDESRVNELRKLGLEFDLWESMFAKLKKYKREAGTARLPKKYTSNDSELVDLCLFVTNQIKLYRKDQLDPDKKKKLRKLGVRLMKNHMGKATWEERFDEMMDFYHLNKTCLPKRDGPLRQWVIELVDLLHNGYVSQRRQQLIDESNIAPFLQRDVIFNGATPCTKKRKATPGNGLPSDVKKPKEEEICVV